MALAEELATDSIRFSCKITAIDTQEHEGSSVAVVHMEDGTVIKAKVTLSKLLLKWTRIPHSNSWAVWGFAGSDRL